MRELDAVNTLLPYMQERTVSSLDSNSPTVELIRERIERTRQEMLITGYWFNRDQRDLYPDLGAQYQVSEVRVSDVDSGLAVLEAPVGEKFLYTDADKEYDRWYVLSEDGSTYNLIQQNHSGRITVPADSLAVYVCEDYAEFHGEFLFNLRDSAWDFSEPVKVNLILDTPFEYLPNSLAQAVVYRAGTSLYVNDFGEDAVYQHLMQLYNTAWAAFHKEMLRKEHYNPIMKAKSTRRFMQYLRR